MIGYKYYEKDGKYQLYAVVNEQGHNAVWYIYPRTQGEIMDQLINEYDAQIQPASHLELLYTVWFSSIENLERAGDWLVSLSLWNRL